MADLARTLAGYIDEVASGSPTPGGGSVAAIVGALGAALGEMVINLSLVRGEAADDEALRVVESRLRALRGAMFEAAVADERAYAGYRSAVALPRGDGAEKRARREAMQRALREATEAPLAVAQAATATAEALETVARSGNPHLRSDAALAALLAEAALRGALLNIRGNAALVRDAALAEGYRADADALEKRGREAAARAYRLAAEASQEADFR